MTYQILNYQGKPVIASEEIADIHDYVDNAVENAGTDVPTPDTVVRRNNSGGTQVAWLYAAGVVSQGGTPTASNHLATKGYTDAQVASVVDESTSFPTLDTLVYRRNDGSGRSRSDFGVVGLSNVPSLPEHATRKDYVDGEIARLEARIAALEA